MNIQGFYPLTLLDFPGRLACEVFVGGCNLRCPFCHNAGPVLRPHQDESREPEVMAVLEKRRGKLTGVCISGGEPLLQEDLPDFIRRVRDMGYAVKLDTNGSLPHRLRALLEEGLLDYVARDVKNAPNTYAAAVGLDMDAAPFLESIRLVKASGIPHEFRTTVVGGIHTPKDLEGIGALLGDETFFMQPFSDRGDVLEREKCRTLSDEELKAMIAAVRRHTPRAKVRGREDL